MDRRILTLDLHTHSAERKVKASDYWRFAFKTGLDAVAITEHSEEDSGKEYERLLREKPKAIQLIPGIELNTTIGHVLAYGKDEGIYGVRQFKGKGIDIDEALEIAKSKDFLLSIAHPWGFSYDSAAFILGRKKLERFVERKRIGVETYDGMIGSLNRFVYESNWIKRPRKFFGFLEENRVARLTMLNKLTGRLKRKMDKKTVELMNRCVNPIVLGGKALFITAGSDAHSADRIGSGVMKIRTDYEGELDNERVLGEVKNKENVIWAGPFMRETAKGTYEINVAKIKKSEIFSGLKYATKKVMGKESIKSRFSKIKNKIKKDET